MGQVCVEYLLPSVYVVFIGPAQGIKPGMGTCPDRQDFMDGYICWQFIIDLEKKILILYPFSVAIKMCIKYTGMDPGVGPTTTGNPDLLSKQEAEVFIQYLLDRFGIGLYLPAVVMGSLV